MSLIKSAFISLGMCCASVLFGQGAVCYGTQRSVDLIANSEQLKKYWAGEVAFQEVIDYAETIGFIGLRDEGHVVLIEEMALPITRVEIILEILAKVVSSESGAIFADELTLRELLLVEELSAVSDHVRDELREGKTMIGFSAGISVMVEVNGGLQDFHTRMPLFDDDLPKGQGAGVHINSGRSKYSPNWNLTFQEVVPALEPLHAYRVYRRMIDDFIDERERLINSRLDELESPFIELFNRVAARRGAPTSREYVPGSSVPEQLVEFLARANTSHYGAADQLSRSEKRDLLLAGRLVSSSSFLYLTFIQPPSITDSGQNVGRRTSTFVKGISIPLRLGG